MFRSMITVAGMIEGGYTIEVGQLCRYRRRRFDGIDIIHFGCIIIAITITIIIVHYVLLLHPSMQLLPFFVLLIFDVGSGVIRNRDREVRKCGK